MLGIEKDMMAERRLAAADARALHFENIAAAGGGAVAVAPVRAPRITIRYAAAVVVQRFISGAAAIATARRVAADARRVAVAKAAAAVIIRRFIKGLAMRGPIGEVRPPAPAGWSRSKVMAHHLKIDTLRAMRRANPWMLIDADIPDIKYIVPEESDDDSGDDSGDASDGTSD